MNIVLQYESSALAAPQSFRDNMQLAANMLDAAIYNNITVTILVGYGDYNNGTITGLTNVADGGSLRGVNVSYTALRAALASHESSSVDVTFVNSLPISSSIDGRSSLSVPSAVAEALGLMAVPSSSVLDGAVGMGTQIAADHQISADLHELTHAIGRAGGTLNLLRFTQPGVNLFGQTLPAPPSYFSIDGGYTKLADFGQTSDSWDFLNTGVQGTSDPFNESGNSTTIQGLTPLDIELLDALGFDVTGVVATLSVQGDPNAIHGQQIALSSLVTIGDPNNYGFQKLELWQSLGGPAGDYFSVNGAIQAAGTEIDLASGNIANTAFVIGNNNGTDRLWARILQNNGTLTDWQQFTIGRMPPGLNVYNFTATSRNQAIPLSSLEYVWDPNALSYQKLELWESAGDVAGDQFVVNGAPQGIGQEIDLSPSDISHTTFNVGALGGTDRLWMRLLQNDGTLSSWQQLTVTSPLDNPPVITAADRSVGRNQNIAANTLFSVSDADNDPITAYQFWDSTADPTSGHWVVGGLAQPAQQAINVTPAQLSSATFQTISGSDHVWVRANDGITWGNWTGFYINAPVDNAPVVSATNYNASHGQNIAATSLFSVSDADNDPITAYQLWDSVGGTGHWIVGGTAQPAGQAIDVTPAQLAGATFQSGSGSDHLWVRANDGIEWGAWQDFFVNAPVDNLPVVSATNYNASHGQNIAASSLFSVSDADSDAITAYQFWDSTADAASGHWVVGNVAQSAGQAIDVTPAQLAGATFQSGSGFDHLWVRANDGIEWGVWQDFFVNAPVDQAPVVSGSDTGLTFSTGATVSSLFQVTDAENDTIKTYQLWDSTNPGSSGHFLLSGAVQPTGQGILVDASLLGQASFVASSTAATDRIWERAFDGMLWSGWTAINVTSHA
jgi:hypothetical protein